MLLDARPLPIRVRPLQNETAKSYLIRLTGRNHLAGKPEKWFGRVIAPAEIATLKGGLRHDHFKDSAADAHRCDTCVTGLDALYGCRLCARGDAAELQPVLTKFICLRHQMWVAPGTKVDDQRLVDGSALAAERKFRKLIRNGRIDAPTVASVRSAVNRWTASFDELTTVSEIQAYPTLVGALNLVTNPQLLRDIFDARRTFAESYDRLERAVVSIAGITDVAVLVDGLWLLLRTSVLVMRRRLDGDQSPRPAHEISIPISTPRVMRPLEPEARYLDQRRTCVADRWRDATITYRIGLPARGEGDEFTRTDTRTTEYLCAQGHRFATPSLSMANAIDNGNTGCGYCSNRKVLAGYNSLRDTRPALASQWHPLRNGKLRPEHVLGGSARVVWWLCAKGHEFEQSLNGRTTSGTGCPLCSNQAFAPGINCLQSTHPELAGEWHPTKNKGLTPSDVLAGTDRYVWWQCAEGHEFHTSIYGRVRGAGCKYCAGQAPIAGETSLQATHPHLAAEWHPTKNGELTPRDVMAGSPKRVWWLCPNGHDHDSALSSRMKGANCGYCANKRLRRGGNDMATARPDLAAEWHPTKNGELTPRDVVPGTSKRIWWMCAHRHEWQVSGDNRVRQGTGCPVCSNKRVLRGANDMATTRPDLAAEWHPTKNGELTPYEVVAGTAKRIWWMCGQGHEWVATGDRRVVKGAGCGVCG